MHTTHDWLTHQLSEFLAAVSAYPDEAAALEGGAERLAESVEAEIVAVVVDGALSGCLGFPPGRAPVELLVGIPIGLSTVDVPGMGSATALAVPMENDAGQGRIVLLRFDAPFTSEEVIVVRGMVRTLGLTLRLLRLLATERTARRAIQTQAEENARLVGSLQERQQLLERLFRIQRSISHRAPLTSVFAAITDGASALLDAEVVALRLVAADDPQYLELVASVGVDPETQASIARTPVSQGVGGRAVLEERLVAADQYAEWDFSLDRFVANGLETAMAAPVYRDGKVAGSLLVATYERDRRYSQAEQDVLLAFAEHTSLALNDASAVQAISRAYDAALHRATHDELTGLPNRALVLDRLGQALARSQRRDELPSVLFVDLDRFKAINDSLGHGVGDEVLMAIAARLVEAVRPGDTVGRLSGDEFVVICEGTSVSASVSVANRVAEALAEPLNLYGRELHVTASVGIARANAADAPEDVVRDADVAMYRAKERGRARVEVFDETIRSQMLARIELEQALRRAIGAGELRLHYQPIVDSSTLEVTSVEALVRWEHPTEGLLYPAAFVPLADETGLVVPLGRWVVEEACRQAAAWRLDGSPFESVRIDVNLSARQFADEGLVEIVADALSASGLEGSALGFEITESVLMEDANSAVDSLRRLKELGVHLSVDDFGTGYSSLSYLQLFPVDAVKIDRSFVQRMDDGRGSDVIVAAVVGLARALDLEVVAEGVETACQLERLRRLGCDASQGYLFARPQPPEQLCHWRQASSHIASAAVRPG